MSSVIYFSAIKRTSNNFFETFYKEILIYTIQDEILKRGDGTTIKSEELWDGHHGGPQPFATLAISQMPAWYDLVLLHVQVANVLYMMACLNLKMLKPLNNLFESVVSKARSD